MFKELDVVRLKKDDPEVNITTKDIGTIVNISEWKGKTYYNIEFMDGIYTNEKALLKDYFEEDLIKAD